MIIELPGRTVVRYPWIAGAFDCAIYSALFAAFALGVFKEPSYLWTAVVPLAYGVARTRRRLIILEDQVKYRPPLGPSRIASFAEVQSVERKMIIAGVGKPKPRMIPGIVLSLPVYNVFEIPLNLHQEEQDQVFNKVFSAWERYREIRGLATTGGGQGKSPGVNVDWNTYGLDIWPLARAPKANRDPSAILVLALLILVGFVILIVIFQHH